MNVIINRPANSRGRMTKPRVIPLGYVYYKFTVKFIKNSTMNNSYFQQQKDYLTLNRPTSSC